MRTTIEEMLKAAGKNEFGFFDVAVGTDMRNRLDNYTAHARAEMVRREYLRKVGSGLVLTQLGYNQ